ncbi:MAG: DegT/DnrJ/EryC1/StrS family aminotransferase [Candidatus Thiodiazotropha sp.]
MSGDEAQLKGAVQALLGNKYSSVYSTGRGAMTTLLSGVKALRSSADSRNEVIMPAYTCYSVASSAINAGLKIRLCDIDPTTLSFDQDKLQQIDFTNVIAIVSANLYGLPNNLVELERLADERGVMLIDDAAQSLNSRLAGRYVGTFGSAGILSLDKGKNATSIQGGLIITDHSDLSEAIVDIYKEVPDLGMKAGLVEFIKVLIYYLFLNPYAYKIPASISFSGLGETRFETDVEIKRYPSFLATLAESQLKRLDEITESRIAHGDFYETHITEKM